MSLKIHNEKIPFCILDSLLPLQQKQIKKLKCDRRVSSKKALINHPIIHNVIHTKNVCKYKMTWKTLSQHFPDFPNIATESEQDKFASRGDTCYSNKIIFISEPEKKLFCLLKLILIMNNFALMYRKIHKYLYTSNLWFSK